MENKLKKVAIDILTSECIYRQVNRSGWICGFGKGVIAFIEDHKNELVINTCHFANANDLRRGYFINDLVTVYSMSSSRINQSISVVECGSEEWAERPDDVLIELAKQKLRFGYPIYFEITENDIDNAILEYYSNQKMEQEERFKV